MVADLEPASLPLSTLPSGLRGRLNRVPRSHAAGFDECLTADRDLVTIDSTLFC